MSTEVSLGRLMTAVLVESGGSLLEGSMGERPERS